jgi:uncharacterized protein YlxW (UPF0749 family)
MSVSTAGTAVGDGSSRADTPPQDRSWVWYITSLSVVLGLLLGLAIRSQWEIRQLRLPANRFSTLAAAYGDLKEGNDQLQDEVRKLRDRATQLETQFAEGTSATRELNRQLQNMKMLAGLTAVRGPGLQIKLQDSPKKLPATAEASQAQALAQQAIVHDQDINAIVSELKAAGAEAIAISGADRSQMQRVTALTTARCAGPGMKVNDTVFGAPYFIYAIGNPADLESQLKIPNGVVDQAMLEPLGMIEIRRLPQITIPAYSGSVSFKHAQKAD